MDKNLLIKLGERIRSLRKARNLSQEELAEKANLHFTYVGRIERGEANFSIGVLYRIAAALGVNIDNFFSFLAADKPLTQKDFLIFEIVHLIEDEKEEDIEAIEEFVKGALKWMKDKE